jgi:hypothetical protein
MYTVYKPRQSRIGHDRGIVIVHISPGLCTPEKVIQQTKQPTNQSETSDLSETKEETRLSYHLVLQHLGFNNCNPDTERNYSGKSEKTLKIKIAI